MLHLKENPTLADLSLYVKQLCEERGFSNNERGKLFSHLLEEAGEFASAARKLEKGKMTQTDLELEAADVLIFLLQICNYYNVDLEKSFRDKEEINRKRTWH